MQDDLQDYINMVNKVQRHTRCNSSYCLRVDRTGRQYCRFGYPKETTESTYLRDDNGKPELVTARNDLFINPHDRLQFQGWRANADLKPILNMNTALQYISKHASKSEPRSAAFSEILNKILKNRSPDDSALAAIQGLLLQTVAERDISAQETCHLLLSISLLYHSSRQFVTVNLNKDGFVVREMGGKKVFQKMVRVGELYSHRCKNTGIDPLNLSIFHSFSFT